MIAYTGETRAKKLRARLADFGIGLVVQRGRVEKADLFAWPRWFYDNLAFLDWRSGAAFDEVAFARDVLSILDLPPTNRPDFAVLPDAVAQGDTSLGMSMSWLHRVGRLPISWALAVQDGMTTDGISWEAPFDVVFVGGTTQWKLSTARQWCEVAHANRKRVHVGRMGSARRVRWARSIGADSIDSALPLWSEENLSAFQGAMSGHVQCGFPWEVPRVG